MSNTISDVLAVIEAETVPDPATAPGKIDPAAGKLIEQARSAGWQSYQPAGPQGTGLGVVVSFDGAGRYRYERTLFAGLREQVICDGLTLWHLYPDLGIGAEAIRQPVPSEPISPERFRGSCRRPKTIGARRGPCQRR